MHYWFDRGIDGFRMDVIPFISKDTTFPEITENDLLERFGSVDWPRYYAEGPKLHAYLREMNDRVLSHYDAMVLGEGAGVDIENALKFVDEERKELDLFFHFDGVCIGCAPGDYKQPDPDGWNLSAFKDVHSRWSDVFAERGWGSIFLGNHDQPRMVSRWGNDAPEFHAPSAKLLQTFILSMRATAFIYCGDEIGMTNIRFDSIEDYRDVETLNRYRQLRNEGKDPQPYLEGWKLLARDNGRTPFQWDESPNAGFSTGNPWIKVNSNYTTLNAASQEDDPGSILNYFRRMIALRKANPVLVYGDYELLSREHPQVYAYSRSLDANRVLVALNFSTDEIVYQWPEGVRTSGVLITNYEKVDRNAKGARLRPYQAVIFSLQ